MVSRCFGTVRSHGAVARSRSTELRSPSASAGLRRRTSSTRSDRACLLSVGVGQRHFSWGASRFFQRCNISAKAFRSLVVKVFSSRPLKNPVSWRRSSPGGHHRNSAVRSQRSASAGLPSCNKRVATRISKQIDMTLTSSSPTLTLSPACRKKSTWSISRWSWSPVHSTRAMGGKSVASAASRAISRVSANRRAPSVMASTSTLRSLRNDRSPDSLSVSRSRAEEIALIALRAWRSSSFPMGCAFGGAVSSAATIQLANSRSEKADASKVNTCPLWISISPAARWRSLMVRAESLARCSVERLTWTLPWSG